MSGASPAVMSEVLGELDDIDGRTPRQVHVRLGCWSLITVRHALRALCEEGSARYTGENSARLYFRTKETP